MLHLLTVRCGGALPLLCRQHKECASNAKQALPAQLLNVAMAAVSGAHPAHAGAEAGPSAAPDSDQRRQERQERQDIAQQQQESAQRQEEQQGQRQGQGQEQGSKLRQGPEQRQGQQHGQGGGVVDVSAEEAEDPALAVEAARELTPQEQKKLLLPLLRLRQACCHPQVRIQEACRGCRGKLQRACRVQRGAEGAEGNSGNVLQFAAVLALRTLFQGSLDRFLYVGSKLSFPIL